MDVKQEDFVGGSTEVARKEPERETIKEPEPKPVVEVEPPKEIAIIKPEVVIEEPIILSDNRKLQVKSILSPREEIRISPSSNPFTFGSGISNDGFGFSSNRDDNITLSSERFGGFIF